MQVLYVQKTEGNTALVTQSFVERILAQGKLGIPCNYEVFHSNPYVLDINNKKLPFSSECNLLALFKSTKCLVSLQEEREAQAKADKIKLALEKLKEAKVKKVSLRIVKCYHKSYHGCYRYSQE